MGARDVSETVPSLSVADRAKVLADVVLPVVARGPIIRRPRVVDLLAAVGADRRAVRRMQDLHERYGPGPLMLEVPGRRYALVLDPGDVRRVLEGSPEVFAAVNPEKRAALATFQPHGVLVSHGRERAERRRLNERVLDHDESVHRHAEAFLQVAVEETRHLTDHMARTGRLEWDRFVAAWFRIVRRVVLGDAARDDHAVTDLLADLRGTANWSLLGRRREQVRARFQQQLAGHLARAEAGSLASLVASVDAPAVAAPAQQVPQWLFAFDAAGWTVMRTLALLTVHPALRERAQREVATADPGAPHLLPFVRACVLDTLRLYPTTPAILRETTAATSWDTGTVPAGVGVLIFTPFFHRDDRNLTFADRFEPDVWLAGHEGEIRHLREDWPLIPFSAGPVVCPGRHLVLLTTSAVLAELLSGPPLQLEHPRRLDPTRLPALLSPFSLAFRTSG